MKPSPHGPAWQPSNGVTLHPVPFKLLRVVPCGAIGECVAGPEYGSYQGQPFDPWQRGDLVVVEMPHSVTYAFGHKRSANMPALATWIVGYRATVPSAVTQKYDFGLGPVTVGTKADLWRVPYRWQAAAAALVGKEFESREALEEAMR